jgi:DNA-binding PadR family transcriptional regulator
VFEYIPYVESSNRRIWDFNYLTMGAGETELRDAGLALGAATTAVEDMQPLAAWLVLALIIEQPSHGYEIHQRYELRFGGFLPTSKPRLYAILNRLLDAGMIELIVLEPIGRPRKQHGLRRSYRATRAGAQAFRCWFAERMKDDPQRPQLLARIASAGTLGLEAVLGVIDRYESGCTQVMKALPTSDPEDAQGGVAELVESLEVDRQRREMKARIDWAVYARRILRARAQRLAAERTEAP